MATLPKVFKIVPMGESDTFRFDLKKPEMLTNEGEVVVSYAEKYTFILTRDEMESLTREALSAFSPKVERGRPA